MHDKQNDVSVEVGHQEEADTAGDNTEELGFVVAPDAASETISNLHMEANNQDAGDKDSNTP